MEAELKHTPGPWKVSEDGHNIIGSGRGMIAFVRYDTDSQCDPSPEAHAELHANARLIEKAWLIPELLEALYEIAAWNPAASPSDPSGRSIMEVIDIARAAIAKATN